MPLLTITPEQSPDPAPHAGARFPGAKYIPASRLDIAWFGNGRIALVALAGGVPSRLSVNLADELQMEPDELAIKTYSENEGVLDALLDAGVIAFPHRFITSGHVAFPICRLIEPSLRTAAGLPHL